MSDKPNNNPTARATLVCTIEVQDCASVYAKEHTLAEIQQKAKEQGLRSIERAFAGTNCKLKLVGEPTVTVVIVPER